MAIPINYQYINLMNASVNPSQIHTKNTELYHYFIRYLLQKVFSVYEFEGLPETWDLDYFRYVLFIMGYIPVFDTAEFGPVAIDGTLSGMNLYYRPNKVIIANPVLGSRTLEIGKDTELIRLTPDYLGIMDLVGYYADILSLITESASTNILNSRLAYVFRAKNKTSAEGFKKMFDKIMSGEPAVFIDNKMVNADGTPTWDTFLNNLNNNFIADKLANELKNWEDRFNTDIGIPNANTQKRERLITDEVNANNVDTRSKVDLWLDEMTRSMDKVNKMFNLSLSVKYRYEEELSYELDNLPEEVEING